MMELDEAREEIQRLKDLLSEAKHRAEILDEILDVVAEFVGDEAISDDYCSEMVRVRVVEALEEGGVLSFDRGPVRVKTWREGA